MNRRGWQWLFTVVVACALAVAMTGCARKGGAGAGGGSGGSGSGTGQGLAGGPGSGAGSGFGGAGYGSGSSLAGGAITGTSLPSLPSPREFVESGALKDVHFEFDQYELRLQDKTVLEANAKWLKSNAKALLLIEGHADERGTNEYNLALGERRAKATRDYLVGRGVDPGRITMTTYGEERPFCHESMDACWAQNRRAHFLIKQ